MSPYFVTKNKLHSIYETTIYSLFNITNLYFYKILNYFDLSARENPLLHLWSLGVEAQFYLIVPLLLLFLQKKNSKFLIIGISVILIMSLTYSVYLVHFSISNKSKDFAFYLLPSRAWELLAGSILYLSKIKLKYKSELIQYCGIVCIILPFYFYSDKIKFPGIAAVPVIIGSAILIICDTSLLRSRYICFIGRISYSLYLFHWPILVLFVYKNHTPLNSFIGMGISFIIAILSWKYIENPARRLKIDKNKYIYI